MRYLLIFLFSMSLHAHALKIFTSEDRDFIHVKAYFSASSPCKNCDANITTNEGKTILKKTDNAGKLTIKKSLKPVKITINASLGHVKSIDIKQNITQKQAYPFLLKMVFAFIFMGIIFFVLRVVKRK